MKELGLSQSELARRMHASRPYVVKVLHGDVNITLGSAGRFAKALEMDFLCCDGVAHGYCIFIAGVQCPEAIRGYFGAW